MLYSPVKCYGHRYKISRVGTFYVAVIIIIIITIIIVIIIIII